MGGLATDSAGRLVIFHRGSRHWEIGSFNFNNRFNPKLGPIADETLALVDTIDGSNRVVQQWGSHLFYMPHGLTIDGRGRLWLTDVGAHQVGLVCLGIGCGLIEKLTCNMRIDCCTDEPREPKEPN